MSKRICSSELATAAMPFELRVERINCPCDTVHMSSQLFFFFFQDTKVHRDNTNIYIYI